MPTDLVSQFNSYLLTAAAALGAGDYDTALQNALAAQTLVAALPSLSRTAGSGGGSQAAQWNAEAVDKLIVRIRQAQAAAQGVGVVNVEYVQPQATATSAEVGVFDS